MNKALLLLMVPLGANAALTDDITFSEQGLTRCAFTVLQDNASIRFGDESGVDETRNQSRIESSFGGMMRLTLTTLATPIEFGDTWLEEFSTVGRTIREGESFTTTSSSEIHDWEAATLTNKADLAEDTYTVTATFTLECGV